MLTYRPMTVADLPAAFAVRLSTIENAMTMEELAEDYGITPESLAAAMETHVQGWLCEEGGRAVGFAMGDRSNGEVQVVAVLPGYEGRGIGKALLLEVQQWLFAQGHAEIWARQSRSRRAGQRLLSAARVAAQRRHEGRRRGVAAAAPRCGAMRGVWGEVAPLRPRRVRHPC
jgi:GNAT superfamily N-acetyltransferase